MRMTKLGVIVASLALTAGTASVLAAGPADAATATKAKLTINGKHKAKGVYGSLVGLLDGSVTDASGNPVDGGSAALQRKLPGKGWKTIKTDDDASFVDFGSAGSKAKGNAAYRVRYSGDSTYSATTSNVVTVTTLWKVKDTSACPGGHCHISGKLTPKAKHKKLVVQVKVGHWKRFKVLHTSAKSKYQVGVSTRGGKPTHYRLLIPGTKSIAGVKIPYVVHRV
jgi:hypothetical protein